MCTTLSWPFMWVLRLYTGPYLYSNCFINWVIPITRYSFEIGMVLLLLTPASYSGSYCLCPSSAGITGIYQFPTLKLNLDIRSMVIRGWRGGLAVKRTCCSSKDQSLFPRAHARQLTVTCNSSSRQFDALFRHVQTHTHGSKNKPLK